jgi:predicted phosphodiesterase
MVRRLARIAVIPAALVAGAAGFEALESLAVAPRFGVRAAGPDARAAMSEHVVTARGAGVVEVGHGSILLRAWAPAPAISILREGATPLTIRLLNVPGRVRLHEAADVVETTEGSSRLISIGGAGRRDLRYVAPSNGAAFAALGDTGSSDTFAQALRTATAIGCDFFLVLGDLFYRDEDVPLVRAVLERASLPVYVVRGHHDYYTARRRESLAALGPSFYAFSYGGAGFVVLDSGYDLVPGVAIESVQYEWLRRTFLLPLGNPLLVATHVSPISRAGEKARRRMLDSAHAARLVRDFEQAGARLVLAGHRHTNRLDVHHGVTYVTAGEGRVPREQHPAMAIVTVQGGEAQHEFVPIWPDTPVGG